MESSIDDYTQSVNNLQVQEIWQNNDHQKEQIDPRKQVNPNKVIVYTFFDPQEFHCPSEDAFEMKILDKTISVTLNINEKIVLKIFHSDTYFQKMAGVSGNSLDTKEVMLHKENDLPVVKSI